MRTKQEIELRSNSTQVTKCRHVHILNTIRCHKPNCKGTCKFYCHVFENCCKVKHKQHINIHKNANFFK